MPNETEIKRRISEKARDRFYQYGFSKVTMDELAAELGMSKKTLYKYFPTKEALLWDIYRATTKDFKKSAEELYGNPSLDFVDKLVIVLRKNSETTSQWSSVFLADIQKHARDIWEEVEKFRQESIMQRFSKFFDEGVAEGFFRKDIDQKLTLTIYTKMIHGLLNPDTLSTLPYSAGEVFETIVKILYEGVLTDTGRTKYRSKIGKQATKSTRDIRRKRT